MGRRKIHRPHEIPTTWEGFYFTSQHIMTHEAYPIMLKPQDFFKRHYEMQLLREYRLKATHPQQWDLVFND